VEGNDTGGDLGCRQATPVDRDRSADRDTRCGLGRTHDEHAAAVCFLCSDDDAELANDPREHG
jgi:hypothetical protein